MRGRTAAEKGALGIWRGYLAHSLLFYRQNRLARPSELVKIGRQLDTGPVPPWPVEPGAGEELAQGLRKPERYWGSLRLADRALEDFERAARLSPSNAWPPLLIGMVHEMHRRYTKAGRFFGRAAVLEPRWAWPKILRGVSRWYLADFAGSIEDFSEAARLDPSHEWPLLFLARSKADVRDRSLVRDLDRAVRLAPRSGFARSWRGRALFVLRRTPEALADLEASIRLLPDYDRGWSWLGVSLIELGRLKPALRLLRRAKELNPYYPTTLYPMAHACVRLGRVAEAGRALRDGAAIDRNGVWIEHRISMGHPNPACLRSLADLDAYLRARPRQGWAWAWRGQTRLLLKDYWKAISDLDRAVSLAPKDAWALTWRGEAWRRLGFPRRALVDLRRALSLAGEISWAHAATGRCLLELEEPARAFAALNRALELSPQCGEALAWRGEARLRLGDAGQASEDLEAALELKPNDVRSPRLLWEARARLGDWREAGRALERVVLDGGALSDAVWARLAWTEAMRGDRARARSAATRALALNPMQPLALRISSDAPPAHFEDAAALAPCGAAEDDFEARLETHCRERESKACWEALRLGRFDEALVAARAERPTSDAVRLVFRGWLRLKLGDARGAAEEASRALDETLDPEHPLAARLRAKAQSLLGEAA